MGISPFSHWLSNCSCSDDSKKDNKTLTSCGCGFRPSVCSSHGEEKKTTFPNPNPRNFRILRHQTIGHNVIVEIKYPDCINYEGRKILVYRDINPEIIYRSIFLDPHFCNKKDHISPFARFEPTEKGWGLAIELCLILNTSPKGI